MLLNWLEKTLECPLDFKEIKPVNHKGNQFWIFIGRTDAEAESPILWPPSGKSWLIGKDTDAGKEAGGEGTTEDELVGWHHWLNGHEFEQALGIDDGQGSLVWCSPWGCKELDTTEQLNSTEVLRAVTGFRILTPSRRVWTGLFADGIRQSMWLGRNYVTPVQVPREGLHHWKEKVIEKINSNNRKGQKGCFPPAHHCVLQTQTQSKNNQTHFLPPGSTAWAEEGETGGLIS